MVLWALCTDGFKKHLKIENLYELDENDKTHCQPMFVFYIYWHFNTEIKKTVVSFNT